MEIANNKALVHISDGPITQTDSSEFDQDTHPETVSFINSDNVLPKGPAKTALSSTTIISH